MCGSASTLHHLFVQVPGDLVSYLVESLNQSGGSHEAASQGYAVFSAVDRVKNTEEMFDG